MKGYRLSLFILLLNGGLLYAEPLPPLILELPQIEATSQKKEQIHTFYSKHPTISSANEWYELALLQIQAGCIDDAKVSLELASFINPEFSSPYVQMGYLYLWEDDLDHAYEAFSKALSCKRCQEEAIKGLIQIARTWSNIEEKRLQALSILTTANSCYPQNPDTLFYLGRVQAFCGHWGEAEVTLKECISLSPNYIDAKLQLANVYLWENNWDSAEKIFLQYPHNVDAQIGLARIANRQGDSKKAIFILKSLQAQYPDNKEVHLELARTLAADRKYHAAKSYYAVLPNKNSLYSKEYMSVRSRTNIALGVDSSYTDSKEDDPSIGLPVVKDYYFLNNLYALIPLNDLWRLEAKQIFYHQHENDIYPPTGVNYNVYLSGGSISSSYFFAKDWKWDVLARSFRAWGEGEAIFPFHQTSRFEPGISLLYNSDQHIFFIEGHVESFIIKNYAQNISQLLRLDVASTGYTYRSSTFLKPKLSLEEVFHYYHDNLHNMRDKEAVDISCGIPFISSFAQASFRFEHSHFKALSPNYTSYKRRYKNTLGITLSKELFPSAYVEGIYEHSWQLSYDLLQPIGIFVYSTTKQILQGNRVTARMRYSYRDRIDFKVEGHYFRDTLPYRDWGLNSSIRWQF